MRMLEKPLPSHTIGRRAALVLAAMLMTGIAGQSAIAQDPKPDAMVAFPPTEKITLTALPRVTPEGNTARIEVRYEKGHELPSAIPLRLAGGSIALRQDPRNPDVFFAEVPFDFEAFVAEQARRQEQAFELDKQPVFRGREIVDHRPIAFIDPERLVRLIREGAPIDVPEDVTDGVAALVSAPHSLMVVHPRVVEDRERTFDACSGKGNPTGVWTFNRLMTDMANQPLTGIHPAEFVEHWLKSWLDTQNVNTFDVDKRPQMFDQVLKFWPRDSKGRLDLKQSPMRLLAIVNRVDLRKNLVYGNGAGGEGRFVFGVMRRHEDGSCDVMPFTVILEYGVPLNKCENVRDYGQKWKDLDSMLLGSSAYNAALQNLTDVFAKANAAPDKPNGSAINQVRTNENALDPLWELREYHLGDTPGQLEIASTVLEPHRATYNPAPLPHTTTLLADFINLNEADILANTYDVPAIFMGQPFLTGAALNPDISPGSAWAHPFVLNNDARHLMSLNTCSSCHGSETETKFLHVEPRNMGFQAALSRFLVGDPGTVTSPSTFTMPDPVSGVPRTFGDLLHRQADLDALVSSSCDAGGLAEALSSPVAAPRTH